jgi:hypothetical protein
MKDAYRICIRELNKLGIERYFVLGLANSATKRGREAMPPISGTI